MSDLITIHKEKLQCLRKHLSEAQKLFESLEVSNFQGSRVQEQKAPEQTPKLTAKQQRINKWLNILDKK